ncbi:MAG: hypothetical protein GY880_24185, partial [Planctomycetaceae bacterium]|nr:hypothetical protein [Planctomycetaceae bacterium]
MSKFSETVLNRCSEIVSNTRSLQPVGCLTVAQGAITASLPASVGELVEIENKSGPNTLAEV